MSAPDQSDPASAAGPSSAAPAAPPAQATVTAPAQVPVPAATAVVQQLSFGILQNLAGPFISDRPHEVNMPAQHLRLDSPPCVHPAFWTRTLNRANSSLIAQLGSVPYYSILWSRREAMRAARAYRILVGDLENASPHGHDRSRALHQARVHLNDDFFVFMAYCGWHVIPVTFQHTRTD